MSIITTTLIAIALSMDAFAVSISSGIGMAKMRLRYALRMALFFGAFQAIMPLAGWSIGYYAADYIQRLDHWIAFILLTVIGAKMIYEACGRCDDSGKKTDPFCYTLLPVLALATSIDAAAVGISISLLRVAIFKPAIIIGIITFFISLAGVYFGKKVGDICGKRFEALGGIMLIGIAIKILLEHLVF
ncbi:MAG: manganese efflux pump [Fibrobacter sp.]|jgi:putative Mn2+ efflux pump MntP|nr:manganese efflux pump [Fibrobacter sp.]